MTIGVGKMNVQTIENIVREVANEIDSIVFDDINEEVQDIVREILHDHIKPEEVI
tara:strand:- start:43 stop:207 length:165 start_codon:yes stop_codon:yes gene_type:complete